MKYEIEAFLASSGEYSPVKIFWEDLNDAIAIAVPTDTIAL